MAKRHEKTLRWLSLLGAAAALMATLVAVGSRRAQRSPHADGVDGDGGAPPAPWVVDAREPGPNLPPAGRSLFDFLVAAGGAYRVPFPFQDLVSAIEKSLGPGAPGALRRVLIPRGRSLQRDAAQPAFFRYPRAVLAVDAEPPGRSGSGPLLKDRLYVAYQETAAVLEVISYNETAARFEFQVVKDYRAGGAPRVVYANRALCMVCHQNGAPIFARPLWDETNANPAIASLLRAERRDFYRFPVEQGVDAPFAIDAATDRANLFSAYQLLWNEGCGGAAPEAISCRAGLLTVALQLRLSGGRRVQVGAAGPRFAADLAARWRARWPAGLSVPTADIPNRNPLLRTSTYSGSSRDGHLLAAVPEGAASTLADLVQQTDVPSEFEPLNPRGPLEIWAQEGPAEPTVERLARGLGELIADVDVRRLDEDLAELPGPGRRYEGDCEVETAPRGAASMRVVFSCGSSMTLRGGAELELSGRVYGEGERVTRGAIHGLGTAGIEETPLLDVRAGRIERDGERWSLELSVDQRSSGLHARRANGERIDRLRLAWRSGRKGRAVLETSDDFARVREAIGGLERRTRSGELDVLGPGPFRRASLMRALEAELGMPQLRRCCEDAAGLAPAALEEHPIQGGATAVAANRHLEMFEQYCGKCHEAADRFPPNFLHGDTGQVDANLAQCAERIFFRLGMWELDAGERPKTPMPPVNALRGLHVSPEGWSKHDDLHALRERAAGLLRSQTGRAPSLPELMARGYGGLRRCLPEAPPTASAARP